MKTVVIALVFFAGCQACRDDGGDGWTTSEADNNNSSTTIEVTESDRHHGCLEGCLGGRTCVAGTCVEPCDCSDQETCVAQEGEEPSCKSSITCEDWFAFGGENNCVWTFSQCENGRGYDLKCDAVVDGKVECRCSSEEFGVQIFEWDALACDCDSALVFARACGIPIAHRETGLCPHAPTVQP